MMALRAFLNSAITAGEATAFSAKDIVSSAMTNAQTEMMGILAVAVPVVAAVVVAVVGVKFGLKWIKQIKG